MRSTAHPVFWLQPADPTIFTVSNFPVFTADISNSAWYGFPYLTDVGAVKIAKHSNEMEMHPDLSDRQITDIEVQEIGKFVASAFPVFSDAPLVFTRRCLYIDTLDGHFWIDNHPEIKGLSVSSGGSGHGLKMAPLLGVMTGDAVEGKTHLLSERFRWRHLSDVTLQKEQARYITNRKL